MSKHKKMKKKKNMTTKSNKNHSQQQHPNRFTIFILIPFFFLS